MGIDTMRKRRVIFADESTPGGREWLPFLVEAASCGGE